jgi:catechol 2,3-dioxygenase-like lactoylglutathione lyase family enzyme
MPEIRGVLETSLYVSDLERSRNFYTRLFHFPVMFEDERSCALNICGRQVLLLFRKEATGAHETKGGLIPPHGANGASLHLAFAIGRDDLDPWERRLVQDHVEIESRVVWPRGGKSLYFRDPDGHLIELASPGLWPIY